MGFSICQTNLFLLFKKIFEISKRYFVLFRFLRQRKSIESLSKRGEMILFRFDRTKTIMLGGLFKGEDREMRGACHVGECFTGKVEPEGTQLIGSPSLLISPIEFPLGQVRAEYTALPSGDAGWRIPSKGLKFIRGIGN